MLADLTQGTGGEFFHDDNDLRSGFSGLTDRHSRYILAFAPKGKLDGKFHAIKVALVEKHNGATVAARRGYLAISALSEPL